MTRVALDRDPVDHTGHQYRVLYLSTTLPTVEKSFRRNFSLHLKIFLLSCTRSRFSKCL